ncbi:oxidoreductase [Dactylonectria estremocensis]|uniref:Oxidoreductase n=1 Tax=Dactylonectria estremocensis TaxID=1079267 RepID=A0A9P9DGS4_9HYPO|nr:oxidoreductase [Dactylonectria estremocensis]
MSNNQAAWVDGPGDEIRIGTHELGKPGQENRQVVWVDDWPTSLGYYLAGEVISTGTGVKEIVPSQRVLACALHLSLKDWDFQRYSIVRADVVTPFPKDMLFEQAAVFPLVLATSAVGLYRKEYLDLPLPKTTPRSEIGKTILIWGGSSSVGCAAIQLAVASGFEVVTTASRRNFGLCSDLGAQHVIDYHSPQNKEDAIQVLRETTVVGPFATIDTIDTITTIAKIIATLGAGFISTTKPPPENLPKGVFAKMVGATDYSAIEGGELFKEYLPTALRLGA